MSEPQNTNGEIIPANGKGKSKPDPQLRAKLYAESVARGKPNFRQACLKAGYSESTANQGPKQYAKMAPRMRLEVQEAVADLSGKPAYSPEALHETAKVKLGDAIHSGTPCATTKEIELLGKFKEHDWWVRPENQMTTNVFTILADPQNAAMRGEATAALDKYHACGWCYSSFDDFEELAGHVTTCPKRPIDAAVIP